MTKKFALLGAAMTCLAVACSSSPATSESTTTAATTIAATTTTVTLAATTTAAPTTVPAPTTTLSPDDQLKAQIAADYVSAFDSRIAMLENPRLDAIDDAIAQFAVPGSENANRAKRFVEELVATGDIFVENDTQLTAVYVEAVTPVGTAPYSEAIVTVCEIFDHRRITPAAVSPTGKDILVGGTDGLVVFRTDEPLRLTSSGWRPYRDRRDVTSFQGVLRCPPDE